MSKLDFTSLQKWHENLLEKQATLVNEVKQDFFNEVKTYIDQAKEAGSQISGSEEREQIRANLRYWGNYIYGADGVFPNTELAPFAYKVGFLGVSYSLLVLLILAAMLVGFGLRDVASEIPHPIGTAIAVTQTAMAWTPTVTLTPSRFDSLLVVNTLNSPLPEDNYLKNSQELEHAIGASYDIVDARLMPANNLPSQIFVVEVNCFCNGPFDCCSPEQSFVEVIRRMEYHRDSILQMVPDTVVELNVFCMEHDNRVGIMSASWQDLEDYLFERINAKQFGSRLRRE